MHRVARVSHGLRLSHLPPGGSENRAEAARNEKLIVPAPSLKSTSDSPTLKEENQIRSGLFSFSINNDRAAVTQAMDPILIKEICATLIGISELELDNLIRTKATKPKKPKAKPSAKTAVAAHCSFFVSKKNQNKTTKYSDIGIIFTSVIAAVIYGIIHDQVTARICVEYFTVGHPRLIDSDSPPVLGLFWGIVATWWAGLAWRS